MASGSSAKQQARMIFYLVFAGLFVLYQLDVIAYAVVALVAAAAARLRPVPGHPAFERSRAGALDVWAEPPLFSSSAVGGDKAAVQAATAKAPQPHHHHHHHHHRRASTASMVSSTSWHIGAATLPTATGPGSVAGSVSSIGCCAASECGCDGCSTAASTPTHHAPHHQPQHPLALHTVFSAAEEAAEQPQPQLEAAGHHHGSAAAAGDAGARCWWQLQDGDHHAGGRHHGLEPSPLVAVPVAGAQVQQLLHLQGGSAPASASSSSLCSSTYVSSSSSSSSSSEERATAVAAEAPSAHVIAIDAGGSGTGISSNSSRSVLGAGGGIVAVGAKVSRAAAAASAAAAGLDQRLLGCAGVPTADSAGSGGAAAARLLLPKSLIDKYEAAAGDAGGSAGTSGVNSGRRRRYFPVVLVQLPMYNEEQFCESVVERAAELLWPRDRLVIQVCDDSTKPEVRARVDRTALALRERGHSVRVARRPTNAGFKAGNLLNGMAALAAAAAARSGGGRSSSDDDDAQFAAWEFVAVLDADFEPPPDFLYQTVWPMMERPELAFVQARWSFTNKYANLLCWMQSVALGFHFAVEQRARSFLGAFFGFNGTGGVWRRRAMEEAGGWSVDSTVEDMDLSLRAFLCGYKALYLHHVACPNELPPTMAAYRSQQHRWNSGPAVVFKTLVARALTTPRVGLWDRASALYFFFRYVYSALLCGVSLLVPAVITFGLDPWSWSSWPQLAFLAAGNASAALVYVWFAGAFFWPFLLLQTALGFFRVHAFLQGLLGVKKASTWKVTAKFGAGGVVKRQAAHRPYALELLLAGVFIAYAVVGVLRGSLLLASFVWVLASTLLLVSFGDHVW